MISSEEIDRWVTGLDNFTSWYLTIRTGLEWVVTHKIDNLDYAIHCSFGNYHRNFLGGLGLSSMNAYYEIIISNCELVIQDRLTVAN